jgi:hypothetical protein
VTHAARGGAPPEDLVGPVLEAGATAEALVAAIRSVHPDARVLDRGAYVRVRVEGRCVLTRAAAERELGRAFRLPGDLERVMPSFQGRIAIHPDRVEWSSESGAPKPERPR